MAFILNLILTSFTFLSTVPNKTPGTVPNKKITDVNTASAGLKQLYHDCKLEGVVNYNAFKQSVEGYTHFHPSKPVITIIDFTLPSADKRCFVVDIKEKKLLVSTWVAHGKNSGDNIPQFFSNEVNSYKSSPGFYLVGDSIKSPKHGLALLLLGLQKGINDNAQKREIIIHGASYVSPGFIQQFGRLGRSHGCPALPDEMMKQVAPVLANGSLLYIYTEIKPQ